MLKFLLKNPKRFLRNASIILIAYIIGACLIAIGFMLLKATLPIWAVSLISTTGSLAITFLVIAILGMFANRRDSELRRRFTNEVRNETSKKVLQSQGVEIDEIDTSRSSKEIKANMKKLATELYHAQERDKNLKLRKKF